MSKAYHVILIVIFPSLTRRQSFWLCSICWTRTCWARCRSSKGAPDRRRDNCQSESLQCSGTCLSYCQVQVQFPSPKYSSVIRVPNTELELDCASRPPPIFFLNGNVKIGPIDSKSCSHILLKRFIHLPWIIVSCFLDRLWIVELPIQTVQICIHSSVKLIGHLKWKNLFL